MASLKWKSEERSLLKHRLEKYQNTALMEFLSNTQLFHLMGKQDKYTPYRRTSKTEYSSTALELKNLSPFLLDFVKNQTIGRKP